MDAWNAWKQFLDPKILRNRLIAGALFITAFEMLKDSIVDRIRDFFCFGFDENGDLISDDYRAKVLSLHKKPLEASLLWLENMGAIDASDIKKYRTLTDARNNLAHEMLAVISGQKEIDLQVLFEDLLALLRKIDVWWVVNLDLATDPDMADKEIDEKDITPGSMMIFQMLMDVALGDEEQAEAYINEMMKRSQQETGR